MSEQTKSKEDQLRILLGKYVSDVNSLCDEHVISFEELKSATYKLYEEVLAQKIEFKTFSWLISNLYFDGVALSKGFGEVYQDRNLIKALEEIWDPRPYIRNPTAEQQEELVKKGAKWLGL